VLDVVVSNTMLNLSRRDADVAVRATYVAPETLSAQRVSNVAWAVFGSARNNLRDFQPRDATNYNWVGFVDHLVLTKVTKWMKDHIHGDRLVYKVNSMLGIAEAVAGGAGLALLPCFVGQSIPGLARLTPPLPELDAELWLVTHPDLNRTARVRTFLDFCAAEIDKRRAILECLD
jgi:DNA-binding transcriptional LysR family regulator